MPSTPERWDNLPAEVSSFVGREQAISDVVGLFSEHRLVTLSGPPGVGKTRLALRAAAALRGELRDGVWVVELAALTEPSLVPSALAAALGLREESQQSLPEMLRNRLRQDRLLLLFDNCEHLLEACASIVDDLLRACPDLQVLTTSREPLGLHGEVCWPVVPLTLPEPSRTSMGDSVPRGDAGHRVNVTDVLASESGRLFVERARAVRQTFSLTDASAVAVAQICHRLDGIPLALELAAARVGALSPAEIAARLDDRFTLLARTSRTQLPRQRTLRESVDWSYELLSEPERILLRRLAIFRGGWSLEAAEAVCSEGARVEQRAARSGPESSLLDTTSSLVEKSLVLVEEQDGWMRYSFLETIREYALERLHEAGETETLVQRHQDWCLTFAEEAATHLRRPDQAAWWARLETEHDNLRAALGRTIARDDAEFGLRLSIALWQFWIHRGYSSEGYTWLQRLLSSESGAGRTVLRAAGLFLAGKLALDGADLASAQTLCEESLGIARETGDPHTLHRTLTQLGHIARGREDWLGARSYYEEALPLRRELGEPADVAVSLSGLAHVARAFGELDTARALFEESLGLAMSQGHPSDITAAQADLGWLALLQGRFGEAVTWFTEALPAASRIEHPRRIAYLLEGFAALAVRDQPERALWLAGAAATLRQTSGCILPPSMQGTLDTVLAPAWRQLTKGRRKAAWETGAALTTDEAVAMALLQIEPPPDPGATPALATPEPAVQLTARERDIVTRVAQGLANRQIAEGLVISERTVEWHVTNCMNKLGVSTRAQLGVWAAQHGLAPTGE